MKIKKFLVQIQFDGRPQMSDHDIAEVMRGALSDGFTLHCFGASNLTVLREEQPTPIPIHHQQPSVRG